jgi:hypothetical protein
MTMERRDLQAVAVAERLGGPGHRAFDERCTRLAALVGGAPAAAIRNWLTGRPVLNDATGRGISRWIEAGMPLPEVPSRRTDKRLAAAPLCALSTAAAGVLGGGKRVTLLLAAAAHSTDADVEPAARRAVAALMQEHKERLLEAVNRHLMVAGRSPV